MKREVAMGEDVIKLVLGIGVPLVLVVAAWIIGSSIEAAHFRRLDRWEQQLSGIMVSDMKRVPPNWRVTNATLVVGEAVIATDYYKVFVAGIRKLVGGRMKGYESLMERARREAIVRMLYQAQQIGANAVWNVRLETSTIEGKQQKKSGGVEIIAYGTALQVAGG
jgi:uncharacterized protein YbjQ (UPF0145 family)